MRKEYKEASPAEELLAYLGIDRFCVGRRYLLSCLQEIGQEEVPGTQLYERIARTHGATAPQLVLQSQRALRKGQSKNGEKWAALFPALDMRRAGLTVFLRCAAEWMEGNEIIVYYVGHEKCRKAIKKDGTEIFCAWNSPENP